jgi:type I restriction enzyme, S subunit
VLDQLPTGWVKTTLGEVCVPVATVQPSATPNAEFTYFDIGGIDNESNRIAETKMVTGREAPSRARQVARTGDILFSTVRTYLNKIARIEHDYPNPVASTGFTVIRPAEGVSSQFLFFRVLSEDLLQPLHALQTGSSYPAVRDKDVFAQPIPLPPSREQERIVAKLDALLSRVTAGEAAARRALERLKRYRAAVLHAAVTGELTRDWRKKHSHLQAAGSKLESGAQLLKRLLQERRARWEEAELKRLHAAGKPPEDDKWMERYPKPIEADSSKLPKLPEGWTWISLDQLAIHLTSGSRDWSKYYGKGSGTFLMAQNIRRSGLDLSFRQAVNPPANDRDRERSQVARNDILVTIVGANTGDVCIVPKELPEHFVCQSVALLRLAVPALSQFVWLYLSSDEDGQKQWRKMIYGAGRPHLGFEHLRVTAVPVPPRAEQTEISREVERRLTAADQLAAALQRQLDRARALRQSLLREAFAGRLVPQDPSEESAAALLARVTLERNGEVHFRSKPKEPDKHRRLIHNVTAPAAARERTPTP